MRKISFLIPVFFMFAQINSYAQEQTDPEEITLKIISTKDKGISIVEDFHETMNQHVREPKAPRFLLYDQKREVAFGIGGFVRVRTAYDLGGSLSNSFGFIPSDISVPVNPLTKNGFNMDASKSTIFFKLLGNNSDIGQYQAYVAGRFTGPGNSFAWTDIYVTLMGFTVGHTWSTFNDLSAVPPTVDFQGPNGAAEMRTTQIRYSRNINKNLSFAIAAELPKTTGTFVPQQTAETSQRIPDIPAYLQYNWGNKLESHIRLSGVMRNMNYYDLLTSKTETQTAFGGQLSTNIEFSSLLEFYGQVTYGKGIEQYINDLSGNGLSLVRNPNRAGKMDAQEALAWFAQMQFNLTKSVFTTVGYSQAKLFPKDGAALGSQYRYGQYVVGNVFYNFGSDFQLGLEYLWGNRVNMNGDKAPANCIQTLIQFNF
jgi:hypothetical protein